MLPPRGCLEFYVQMLRLLKETSDRTLSTSLTLTWRLEAFILKVSSQTSGPLAISRERQASKWILQTAKHSQGFYLPPSPPSHLSLLSVALCFLLGSIPLFVLTSLRLLLVSRGSFTCRSKESETLQDLNEQMKKNMFLLSIYLKFQPNVTH